MYPHLDKELLQSKNVRKFTSKEEVAEYLSDDVFKLPHFIKHVKQTAIDNNVSYLLAYDLITKHLIDILYEIDKNVVMPRKKTRIRVFRCFSLQIGFMMSDTKTMFKKQFKKRKR
jgi:hypothetical protein